MKIIRNEIELKKEKEKWKRYSEKRIERIMEMIERNFREKRKV